MIFIDGPTVVSLDPEAAAAVLPYDGFLRDGFDSVIAPDGSMTVYIPTTAAVAAAHPGDVTRIEVKGDGIPSE